MGFFTTRSLASLAAVAALLIPAQAQTYTTCNPLEKTCPPDKALGTTVDIDFTAGERSDFTNSGTVTYGKDGLEMAVSSSNKGPYMQSDWYMMFGRVDVTMKAAPGAGVVSSFILQSDDLDEIDLEWVGSDPTTFQTNFFGKGFTGNYDRGETYETVDAVADFHTYSIDWTAERIQWIIDGQVLRTLVPSDFPGQYPQSPMFVKFGPWAAGDPENNPKGTVHWANGPIDYSAGPYPMYVQSITASDYSTGTAYKYTDNTGTWQSIEAVGGSVNGDGSGGAPNKPSKPSKPSSSSTSIKSLTSSKPKGKTTSLPIKPSTSTPPSGKATSSKKTSGKATPSIKKPSKPTSSPQKSSKPTSSTDKSGPASTSASSKTDGTSSSTGASTSPTAKDNGTVSGKQMAWALSLLCVAVGIATSV
jgi:hypothetical protein